jgi:hypothetical protein
VRSNQRRNRKKAVVPKQYVNLAVAIFNKFADLRLSPAQVRGLAKACVIVSQEARNAWHTMQIITVLFDEAEEDGVPLSKWGTYIFKRVQDKPLPRVSRSFNPFVRE